MDPTHLPTAPDDVLDPAGFGDSDWAAALSAGDADRARQSFVTAFREGPTRTVPDADVAALKRRWFGDDPGFEHGFDLDPDAVVNGRYVGCYGVEHTFDDGVDWFANPTTGADHDYSPEWQWQLNRHYQWVTLADAYEETGDERYARHFEGELRSWIADCPRPDDGGNHRDSAWRTIEAGIRAGWTWPYALETFRTAGAVSDEAVWLAVCSLRDHGRHLLDHVTAHNWKTMETNGLAHVGGTVPELEGARTALATAADRAVAELERQFYPDGLQQELAPNYGFVALANLYSALELAARRGERQRRAVTVPRRARERLRTVARAYARLATPDGACPPLHDSGTYSALAPFDDLVGGDPPYAGGESDHLAWGGYGVLRREGRYAMLDAGPYGAGHQHQDTLQVVAHDGDWALVDPGGPQYSDSPVTDHLRSAAAHNVVLLDGERHAVRPSVPVADDPLPQALATGDRLAATAAARSFETDGGALFDHERVLCDVARAGWLVVDRVTPRDDRPHAAEWVWGVGGDPAVDGHGATVAREGAPDLRVTVAPSRSSSASTAAADRDPYRGWQPTGERKTPGPLPTVRVAVAADRGPIHAATLLSTTGATVRDAAFGAGERSVTVATDDGPVTVRFRDGGGDGDDSGRVDAITLAGATGRDSLSLSGHALLAETG